LLDNYRAKSSFSFYPEKAFSVGTRTLLIAFTIASLLGSVPADAQTIPLSPERTGHAATLLYSGKVLIAGGVNETATIASALLYDPAIGAFAPTGAMKTARANHTATLLLDGRVLITGGDQGFSPIATAELYDPATGVFTTTTHPMSTGRSQHIAMLLPSGKVLVDGNGSADIFDPAAQTFTPNIGTPVNRKSHTAVLLADGTVLITGGYINGIASATAEIYDPATQIFTATVGTMQVPRANHTSTLMPSGKVFITGGFSGTSPHSETEFYDPGTQMFTVGATMLFHRSNHRAILQGDGKLLVIGGVTLESGFLAVNELFDPVTQTWTEHDDMVEDRAGHTATALQSGNILVAGGVTGNQTLQSAEVIDPVTHQFTAINEMQVPRNQHTATLLQDGRVLLTAGSTDTNALTSGEIFNPTNNTFTLLSSTLTDDRKNHTATLLNDGRVLIAGGRNTEDGKLRSAELFDPATSLFTVTGSMKTVRALHTATLLNTGQPLLVGGVVTGGGETNSAETYDPTTESFGFAAGHLMIGRKRHRASLLNDGTVLISGGTVLANTQGGGDRTTETAELYDPATDSFTQVGDMSVARSDHYSVLLEDGSVIITGGTVDPEVGDLYDTGTKTFSPSANSMLESRGRLVSLRLMNAAWGSLQGHVLAIGGSDIGSSIFGGAQQALASVEIYDPATKQFSNFGTMTVERQNHTATELNDGRILIAGGVGRPFVSATAEVLAGPTPSPAPTPAQSKPLNISTRGDVETGDKVMIGGFILAGGDAPKRLIIRAIGPSLSDAGITDALADPILELHDSAGVLITSNDNWKTSQQADIDATGLAPSNDLESAIIATLSPFDPAVEGSGIYTAIVSGKNNGTGVGLAEVYDLDDPSSLTYLANISTRGFVQPDDKAMIGGFIIGAGAQTGQVVVRAIGPSLTASIPEALQDPTLNLYNAEGTVVAVDDDWEETNKEAIAATGLAPNDSRESAILADLAPGAYTAIVQGKAGTSGVGLVEVYYIP
jgi:hypothetical protein